jgi:hypothetical protein
MHRAFHIPLLGSLVLVLAADCKGLQRPASRSESVAATPVQPAPPAPAAAPLPQPAAAPPKPKPSLAPDSARFDQIRRGLRRLVVAEESYYAENGIYTQDLGRIGYKPEGQSEVRFLWSSRGGWAARGTHPGLAGRDCVVYVGREHQPPATIRDAVSGKEGVPVCDGKPALRPASPAPATTAAPAPAAKPPAKTASGPDTTSALDEVSSNVQMRVDLRNLVRSQESYVGNQGVYSRRMEPFALQYLWRRGVTITILNADDASWSARATHATRPGKSCVVWVGPVWKKPATQSQKRVPEEPGTPVCDD